MSYVEIMEFGTPTEMRDHYRESHKRLWTPRAAPKPRSEVAAVVVAAPVPDHVPIEIVPDPSRPVMPRRILDGRPVPKIREVQRAACARYRISLEHLLCKARTRNLVQQRHIAIYICRKITGMSFPRIAKEFDWLDHSTCIHATRKITALIETDPAIRADVESIEAMVFGSLMEWMRRGRPNKASYMREIGL